MPEFTGSLRFCECAALDRISTNCKNPGRNINFKNKASAIDDDEIKNILNKENTFYINGKLFRNLADTGFHYNFIYRTPLKKLELETCKNTITLKLHTCLEQPFSVTKHTFKKFDCADLDYGTKFFLFLQQKDIYRKRGYIKDVSHTKD